MNLEDFRRGYEKAKVEEVHNKVLLDPVVSVCVSTFQHGPFIKDCLEGILQQKTDFPIEILIGDDGSTDGTREICLEYARKEPTKIRLFLHRRENNIHIMGRPTGRFNMLYNIYQAKGKYVAFCEGDDYWNDPFKLQRQVQTLATNDRYVLSFHDRIEVDKNKIPVANSGNGKVTPRDLTEEELMRGKLVPPLTVLFRRSLFPPLTPHAIQIVNLDTYLFAMMGQFGSGHYAKDVAPAGYRIHSGGTWSTRSNLLKLVSSYDTFKAIHKDISSTQKPIVADVLFRKNEVVVIEMLKYGDAAFMKFYKEYFSRLLNNRRFSYRFLILTAKALLLSPLFLIKQFKKN